VLSGLPSGEPGRHVGFDMPRRRSRRGLVLGLCGAAAVLAVLAGGSVAWTSSPSDAPLVRRDEVYVDEVRRGELVRDVRGTGTLQPNRVQWLTTPAPGRVSVVNVQAGAVVEADTIIAVLTNPTLELEALEAERDLAAAQSAVEQAGSDLGERILAQQMIKAELSMDLERAKQNAESISELGEAGHVSTKELRETQLLSRSLEQRERLAEQRVRSLEQTRRERLDALKSQVDRHEKIVHFRRKTLESLTLRATVQGVVQDVVPEPGQWIEMGGLVAKVARPDDLKVVLKVPEVLAKDITVGQSASVDTFNAVIAAEVMGVEPVVQQGSVTVNLSLVGELPKGARPDLTVEGTITLDRIPQAVYLPRPSFPLSRDPVSLFVLAEDSMSARRVDVVLGAESSRFIQVLDGLQPGDRVILSEVPQAEGADSISLR